MATISSVSGPLDSDCLGFTLMHEHVLIADWSMRQAFPDYIEVESFLAEAVVELKQAVAAGVRTMVDLTPINLGRDIEIIRAAAEGSGMQILAATGFYFTEEPRLEWWSHEQLLDYLLRDLGEGIQGTGIKAAIIKCATDRLGVTELNRKLLEVSARAHRRSGVPISTHSSAHHENGLLQQDVFEAEGVDLSRVVIGHCGDSQDLAYLEKILSRGSTIGMDRFGVDMLLPTEQRVGTIVELCKRGWAKQMVLSHDASCHIDWFSKEMLRQTAPRWNFLHIPADVVPSLREHGVAEEHIHAMTVANPARIFASQGAY
ncbi:MAG TPA: hypothetical protein VEB21_09170 [Terriglobales bacterium]|nr:hypothetical protein [Terriglobales bacterium]